MTPRIYTSEPAYKPALSQWQRDRATGQILPMAQPMSGLRFIVEALFCGAVLAVPFAIWCLL